MVKLIFLMVANLGGRAGGAAGLVPGGSCCCLLELEVLAALEPVPCLPELLNYKQTYVFQVEVCYLE